MTTYTDEGTAAMLHRGVLVVLVSVLAGVLTAGALFPFVGGLGLAARAGAESFLQLPEELRDGPLPQRSRILAADGSTLATIFFNENRILVPIGQIPPHMQLAILGIEDKRYYQHAGVDLSGVTRAFVKNQQAGEVTQGGSTITQQYVKNVLIESAVDRDGVRKATERSTTRKLREAKFALALEQRYTKREILEKYLNIAYFGQGVYGVGTAAQHYFSKRIDQITVGEAALLAGMVKNPTQYDPVKRPAQAQARRDVVLTVMRQERFITPAEALAASAVPVAKMLRPSRLRSECGMTIAPYFCAYVRDALVDDERLGATAADRIARVFQGGLTVRTTLVPSLQAIAQKSLDAVLDPPDRSRAAATAILVRPGTGEVLALASNQVYGKGPGQTEVNHALGGTQGIQAGSTFKVFVLAAAVKQGIPLALALNSPGQICSAFRDNGPSACPGGRYRVTNYGGRGSHFGVIDLAKATASSVNTYYVQLEERTGLDRPHGLAQAMGIRSFGFQRNKHPSLVLGAPEVSPLEMAEAYATLAARGKHCPATGYSSITDPAGVELLVQATNPCRQVLEPAEADAVTAMLRGVITEGSGKSADIGRPAAGKTGTSQDSGSAWFIGYTPQLAGSVSMAHPDKPVRFPLVRFKGVRAVTGGSFPAQIWRAMMGPAHAALPVLDFVPPDPAAYRGKRVGVPDLRGLEPKDALETLRGLGLKGAVSRTEVPAFPIAPGLVGASNPAGGAEVPVGATVLLFLSNGRALPPPPVPSPSPSPTVSSTASPSPGATRPPGSPQPGPTGQPTPSPTPQPTPTPSPTPTGEPMSSEPDPSRSPRRSPTAAPG
ncbi:MAG TPA: transglycosylase domain-containing protein [Mycobacteriales bacterium]|nr:transglycosylase domain-containing protein [Mycobacteriales bacterium]